MGWLPVASPALGLIMGTGSVVAYNAYQSKQLQARIQERVKEQEEAIAILQTLLKESVSALDKTAITTPSPDDTLINNRYQILEPLGSGGFGKTYRAIDTNRPGSPPCVVKHLQPARSDAKFLEVARRLFRTEAEIMELLGKHPQIPLLLAFFEVNGQFYLVQELIEGRSLDKEFVMGEKIPQAQVIDLLKDVLKTLTFIHGNLVIHRDIKPGNLIRRKKDNRIVVIDFGAVKQIQQQEEETNNTVGIGSAGYAPPEQTIGQPRLNSDIYALGMVGIEALTGIPPKRLERDADTGRLLWLQHVEVRREFAEILEKMVSYDFTTRYKTTEEVLRDLEKL
jgi:serine/threonine protein kinase